MRLVGSIARRVDLDRTRIEQDLDELGYAVTPRLLGLMSVAS